MKTRTLENPLAANEALRTIFARVPEYRDVLDLKEGDMAPTCFGNMARVTRIFARKQDIKGRWFVCYYTALNDRDTVENGCGCSTSMKEGELIRTVALTGRLNSAECDALEREMNQPKPRNDYRQDFDEADCGGVFNGFGVVSDADPGL